jgi:hypothetical protein
MNAAQVFGRHNRTSFWIGHQTARTQDAPEPADLAHQVWGSDSYVEIGPAPLYLGQGLIIVSDDICAGLACQGGAFALCKYQYAYGFTQPVRQNNDIADLLVRMAGIYSQPDMRFDGCIEGCYAMSLSPGPALPPVRNFDCGPLWPAAARYFFPCFGINPPLWC